VRLRGGYGEATAGLWRYEGEWAPPMAKAAGRVAWLFTETGRGVKGCRDPEKWQRALTEAPSGRGGRKSEFRNPKPAAYPRSQAENDQNHCPAAGFEHCTTGNPGLFRDPSFGFRVFAPLPSSRFTFHASPGRQRRASLWGWGGDAEADHFRDVSPAVNVLAGANPDRPAGFGLAIPPNVKLGDVAPAVGRGRQQPKEGEVLHPANPGPDRRSALHQNVLRRRAGDAQLEGSRLPDTSGSPPPW